MAEVCAQLSAILLFVYNSSKSHFYHIYHPFPAAVCENKQPSNMWV